MWVAGAGILVGGREGAMADHELSAAAGHLVGLSLVKVKTECLSLEVEDVEMGHSMEEVDSAVGLAGEMVAVPGLVAAREDVVMGMGAVGMGMPAPSPVVGVREVIYISDDESSDSSVKPPAAGLLDVKHEARSLQFTPRNGEGKKNGHLFPDAVLHQGARGSAGKHAVAGMVMVKGKGKGKEKVLVVPKAEVIYGAAAVGPEAASCREVALAKVSAEWGQLGASSGFQKGAAQGAMISHALLQATPVPLAAREPGEGGPSFCARPAPGTGNGKNNSRSLLPDVPRRGPCTVGSYIVQCCRCDKWRWTPNQQVYEYIREMNTKHPFVCEYADQWSPGMSCTLEAEICLGDGGFVWAIDKSNIARPPPGWERKVVIRGEGSSIFSDVYYITPEGKSLRSMNEVVKFLGDHPEVHASLAQFNYSRARSIVPGPKRKRQEQEVPLGLELPPQKLLKN